MLHPRIVVDKNTRKVISYLSASVLNSLRSLLTKLLQVLKSKNYPTRLHKHNIYNSYLSLLDLALCLLASQRTLSQKQCCEIKALSITFYNSYLTLGLIEIGFYPCRFNYFFAIATNWIRFKLEFFRDLVNGIVSMFYAVR